MITLVLAEDHHVVRQGIKALLSQEKGLRIIGEASDGIRAVELTEELKPDILLLDLRMEGMNGLDATRQISKRSPQTGIIILSAYGNEAYVLEALRAGARGYVLKDATSSELVSAIKEVAGGRSYLSSPFSERAIESYLERTEQISSDPFESLTSRERDVLYLVAQGFTSSQIAMRLSISRRTAETHRTNLMRKLGVSNKSHLIRYAIERGIVTEG
jgi:DNA-binding NarL/FixJ family response regulator